MVRSSQPWLLRPFLVKAETEHRNWSPLFAQGKADEQFQAPRASRPASDVGIRGCIRIRLLQVTEIL